jgi:Protein of unknown function (DUF4239)
MIMLQGLALSLIVAAVSTAALFIVRRFVGQDRLKEVNDVSGFYFTIIGTIYAVILAFMVFAVWTDYQVATDTVEKEANAAIGLAHMAFGYPREVQQSLVTSLLGYGHAVVDEEWPAMSRRKESGAARQRLDDLWNTSLAIHPETIRDQVLLQQTLTHLSTLREMRRSRLLKSKTDLPPMLWDLLLFGGFLTLFASLFFGVRSFSYHAFQTGLLAMVITFVLFALQTINHPFQGAVHVSADALEEAVRVVDGLQRRNGGTAADHHDPKEEHPNAVEGGKR